MTAGETEPDGTTKDPGTDRSDRGDSNVITIMGGGMAPTLPTSNLRANPWSRKVAAAVVAGAMVTMEFGGSKALAVLEEEEAGDRKEIGPTIIR